MITTKNWIWFIKFVNVQQIKIGLAGLFQLAATKAIAFLAPSTKDFPGGVVLWFFCCWTVWQTSLSSSGCKFHQKIQCCPALTFVFICLLGNLFSSGFNPRCIFALYPLEGFWPSESSTASIPPLHRRSNTSFQGRTPLAKPWRRPA